MINPEQQFGAMRPDTKDTRETDTQKAQEHKDKIDAIVNKRLFRLYQPKAGPPREVWL